MDEPLYRVTLPNGKRTKAATRNRIETAFDSGRLPHNATVDVDGDAIPIAEFCQPIRPASVDETPRVAMAMPTLYLDSEESEENVTKPLRQKLWRWCLAIRLELKLLVILVTWPFVLFGLILSPLYGSLSGWSAPPSWGALFILVCSYIMAITYLSMRLSSWRWILVPPAGVLLFHGLVFMDYTTSESVVLGNNKPGTATYHHSGWLFSPHRRRNKVDEAGGASAEGPIDSNREWHGEVEFTFWDPFGTSTQWYLHGVECTELDFVKANN